ncbi:MAG: NADH-quinone oxidoreductase subunit NuoD [Sorangium cellulosum]|nr:MAG: NADH-quinone oxidoreductase subunit NuoD [Sorangium cellulosum]
MEPLDQEVDEGELELPSDPMQLMMGPSHPAMHGTVRVAVELSGETVNKADVQIGYLHRGFEKSCERGTWSQVFPYVDRCNYSSPMLNNVGYALAVEKLCGLQVPDRCQYYRVILGELARMADHLVCNAAMGMELGAFTPFLWWCRAREMIYDLFEEETGARVTHSFCRIGGMVKPPTDSFKEHVLAILDNVVASNDEGISLLETNRIFMDRTMGISSISGDEAIAMGWTGPCLRSAGVPYDVRKAHPYLVYDRFEFDVPVGHQGDNYDRFMVRGEEIHQSARIIRQAIEQMPDDGPICADDPRVVLPPKAEVYNTIEATIHHFKIIMEGLKVPAGEAYGYTEAANGELGFYVISDGSGTPARVRIRPPSFAIVGALGQLVTGQMVPDIIPTFGSMNMIGGECDH